MHFHLSRVTQKYLRITTLFISYCFFSFNVTHNAAAIPEYSSEYKTVRGYTDSASTKREC